MDKNNLLSKNISKGGIFTGLGVLSLYLTTLIPINKMFFLLIASAIIPLCFLSTNLKTTIIAYIATSILGFILIPYKIISFLYIILFGCYGIIKYFIESMQKPTLEIILKLCYFNICIFITYYFYKTLLFRNINFKLPIFIIITIIQFLFILYDYALTTFINYYKDNIINKLK